MNQKLLALYGLKWNPFSPEIPLEALLLTPRLDNFCWRVENMVGQGGFALVTGEPGLGKSITLRLLVDKLRARGELTVGILTRPQTSLHDFYRELGDLFQVQLSPHNRWAGTRLLRERWLAHIETALVRPVLVIDEAQEMQSSVLSELRLLCAADLDSRCLLTVVLGGDSRLTEKFRAPELLPLGSRIRVRLMLQPATPQELIEGLRHGLAQAGNPHLMTPELMTTLTEHAAGPASMADFRAATDAWLLRVPDPLRHPNWARRAVYRNRGSGERNFAPGSGFRAALAGANSSDFGLPFRPIPAGQSIPFRPPDPTHSKPLSPERSDAGDARLCFR